MRTFQFDVAPHAGRRKSSLLIAANTPEEAKALFSTLALGIASDALVHLQEQDYETPGEQPVWIRTIA